jgi:hypothetical protein
MGGLITERLATRVRAPFHFERSRHSEGKRYPGRSLRIIERESAFRRNENDTAFLAGMTKHYFVSRKTASRDCPCSWDSLKYELDPLLPRSSGRGLRSGRRKNSGIGPIPSSDKRRCIALTSFTDSKLSNVSSWIVWLQSLIRQFPIDTVMAILLKTGKTFSKESRTAATAPEQCEYFKEPCLPLTFRYSA